MNKKLKRKMVTLAQRLLRIPRTRGFGVQSPTAYSILRHVISEDGFLKKARAVESQSCAYPFFVSKEERLLFRIRYFYPDTIMCFVSDLQSTAAYESLFEQLTDCSVLVVKGISEGEEAMKTWSKILADKRTVLSFDLLDCGIVFLDKTKIKQNFKVNY